MAHGASGAMQATDVHAHEHEHPGERTYIKVAAILAAITVVEVAIYYFGLSHGLLITLLLGFSAVKFVTVVGFFMHLKFDDRRLTYIFVGGLFLGFAILMTLDVLHDAVKMDYAKAMFTGQVHSEPAE